NLGDVIVEGDDIHGDGVNIAARLEGLADPGGICVSRPVHTQVENKVDLNFEDLGEQKVKNVPKPVQVFAVLMDSPAVDRGTDATIPAKRSLSWPAVAGGLSLLVIVAAIALWQQPWERREESTSVAEVAQLLSDKPTIAVLPFNNMSNDSAQDYFADGITEDLITDLAKFPGLQVTARTSTSAYKGQALDLRKIGRDLGVQYLIEGSIEKGGDRLRVTAQLIDAASGNHIWADRYDREVTDLFVIRDEIRASIIGALTGHTGAIVMAEVERASRQSPNSVKARDLYYQALGEWPKFNREANARARELLQRSVTLDPQDAAAHALLAWTHWRDVWIGWSDDAEVSKNLALETAETAVELDRSNYRGYWALGSALRLYDDYDTAGLQYERAFELNPYDPDLLADWGELLRDSGEFEKAAIQLETALALNPNYPDWYLAVLASTYLFAERYDEAIRTSSRIVHPTTHNRATLAVSLTKSGRLDAAKAQIAKLLAQDPSYSIVEYLDWPGWERRNPEKVQSYVDALRRAGLPE
ncbi:MAG: adenylate/guanylate cyclase domain-containing protein, partial [Acidiferrobacterales bacterium]